MCRRAWGSRPEVGSSRNRSSGSLRRATARPKPCFCPPERVRTRALAFSLRPTREGPRRGPAPGEKRSEKLEDLADPQIRLERAILEEDAHFGLLLWADPRHFPAEKLDLTGVGKAQALQDLHGGGLSCAVWAKEGEDRPGPNGKGNTVHGPYLALAFSKLPHPENQPHTPSLTPHFWTLVPLM